MDIVVIGSLNMDMVVRTNRSPNAGETLIGQAFALSPGGKGANQAVAAARLGAEVSMIGRVGKDTFGSEMLEIIRNEGIHIEHISVVNMRQQESPQSLLKKMEKIGLSWYLERILSLR